MARKKTQVSYIAGKLRAVSNSSWANFGYLVTGELEEHQNIEGVTYAFRIHGLGLVKLNALDLTESQIPIPALERADVDGANCNRLAAESSASSPETPARKRSASNSSVASRLAPVLLIPPDDDRRLRPVSCLFASSPGPPHCRCRPPQRGQRRPRPASALRSAGCLCYLHPAAHWRDCRIGLDGELSSALLASTPRL